jgi:hypothetical protein
MKKILFTLFFASCILLSSCSDEFSPTGELLKNYAAYSVLDTRLNNHMVLVQKLYFNENSNENLENMTVILSEKGGQSLKLKDTSLNNYKNYNAFYISNYKLKRDITYRLTIYKDDYPLMYSDTYIDPALNTKNFYVKETKTSTVEYTTWKYKLTCPRTKLNPLLIKFFLQISRSYNDQYQMPQSKSYQLELPISFVQNISIDQNDIRKKYQFPEGSFTPLYSSFITSTKWDHVFTVNTVDINATITDEHILMTLLNIIFDPKSISIDKAYVVYYAVDNSLYENYIAAAPVNYSVRLDEPFVYTNFTTNTGSGIGYFGSVSSDTCVFKIDPEMFTKYGFNNGQN